jgi:hypothetical protein
MLVFWDCGMYVNFSELCDDAFNVYHLSGWSEKDQPKKLAVISFDIPAHESCELQGMGTESIECCMYFIFK